MKYQIVISVVSVGFLLSGCGSPKATTTTTTNQPTQQIGSIEPLLTKSKYVRQQLTDPALYDYLQKNAAGVSTENVAQSDSLSQKKIGVMSNFSAASKYAVKGTVTVLSTSAMQVKNFTYNGGCGPLKVGITLSNNSTKILATLKEISQPVSDTTFSLDIPQNIVLSQFDALGLYCPNIEDPVSTAEVVAP